MNKDKDQELMEDLGDRLCKYCPWTNYGETNSSIHTPNGTIMCEGSHCQQAFENYMDEVGDEEDEPIETDWRADYSKWKGDMT